MQAIREALWEVEDLSGQLDLFGWEDVAYQELDDFTCQ